MKKHDLPVNVLDVILLKTLTIVLPLLCILMEAQLNDRVIGIELGLKWFLLSAVGLRLLIIGLRRLFWLPFLIGVITILSGPFPAIRIPVAIVSGIYFFVKILQQLRSFQHTFNYWMEVLTDILIFISLCFFVAVHDGW